MIKIIVDAFGGDNSPQVNVDGTLKALENIADLKVVLVGDEKTLGSLLEGKKYDGSRLEIVHAPDVITCNDKPTEAIKTKKDSSMAKSFELLKTDEEAKGMVSLGSTGALLAGAVLKIGRIKGVKRPAFCPILPNVAGGIVALCDSGANVDCTPQHLQQFGIMGSLFLQKAYGIENPRVSLLNIGVEEEKGDQVRKDTYPLLAQTKGINFVGNLEARDFLSGQTDVVVADGFSGNVLLKSTEGACLEMLKMVKKAFMANLKTKIGALLLKSKVYEIKDLMDYNNYGGAVLLGANKTIVKSHGSSKAEAVFQSIKQAYNMEKNEIRAAIAEAIAANVTAAE